MKYLLLIGLLATAHATQAQAPAPASAVGGHVVSIGIPTLAGSVSLQFEQRLGRHFSLGLWGSRFFSADYPGYQAVLAARYYFRPTAPTGLYLQAQVGAISHDAQVVSDYPGSSQQPVTTTISSNGGGLGLGYQRALTRHLLLNAGLGLRLYPRHWGVKLYDSHYLNDWDVIGQPGTQLDGQLSVGYAF